MAAGETAMSGGETVQPTEEDSMTNQDMTEMTMKIGDTQVAVEWADNEAVEALRELVKEEPLTIQMSMYGGFEQVGPIGQRLPASDSQTTTQSGDIVLYTGSQIVVFYGSNSWAYTRKFLGLYKARAYHRPVGGGYEKPAWKRRRDDHDRQQITNNREKEARQKPGSR